MPEKWQDRLALTLLLLVVAVPSVVLAAYALVNKARHGG